jgi:DNA-directed RNA polymerase I subunit RPA1
MKAVDYPIRHEVDGLSFSFYSDEEVRRLSVKEITSSVVFDAFNNAVPGGLYDASLGPTENHIVCPTCFMTFEDCPGHMGE